MSVRIALLPGDGIGPEVMAEARLVLLELERRFAVTLELDEVPCGGAYYLAHDGRDWPADAAERCGRADLILLGAVGWPRPDGRGPVSFPDGRMAGWSAVLGNRQRLDLFANVRPVRLLPGVRHRVHGKPMAVWQPGLVDLVIVRENTEGLYAGIGGALQRGAGAELAIDTRVVTREESERIIRYAFELSIERSRGAPADGRRRVTSVSKDNLLFGCKLWSEVFWQVAAEYEGVDAESVNVDAFALCLLTDPEHYDVCVTTNLFGDIVTDVAAALQGGLGMAVGGNIGERHAMFEPVHGSAPSLVGGKANPMAMILATAQGLRWLAGKRHEPALREAAHAVEAAVAAVALRGAPLTADLVGEGQGASTAEVGAAVREAL